MYGFCIWTLTAVKIIISAGAGPGEDVGNKTVKGAKKTGNWFTRAFKKIF